MFIHSFIIHLFLKCAFFKYFWSRVLTMEMSGLLDPI